MSERNPTDLINYLAKAGYVAGEIAAGRFYKRPGMWCKWCDYLAVCLRDQRKVDETLVKIGGLRVSRASTCIARLGFFPLELLVRYSIMHSVAHLIYTPNVYDENLCYKEVTISCIGG